MRLHHDWKVSHMADDDVHTEGGRGPDDADTEGRTPTLDEGEATTPIVQASDATLDRFTGITPGEVIEAAEVDQSGQVPPEGAREWSEDGAQ